MESLISSSADGLRSPLAVDRHNLSRLSPCKPRCDRCAGHVCRLMERISIRMNVPRGDTVRDAMAQEGRHNDLRVPGVGGDAAEGRPQRVKVPASPCDSSLLVQPAPNFVDPDEGGPFVLARTHVVVGEGLDRLGGCQQFNGSSAEREYSGTGLSTPEADDSGFKV